MSIPLQLYDFIAILFPAILTYVLYGTLLTPPRVASTVLGGLATALIILYVFGHLLALASHYLERWPISGWILGAKQTVAKDGYIVLNGRKSPIVLPAPIANAILESATAFYRFEVKADDPNLFDLVYSPVYDRLAKRDVFLSLANMMRTLTFLAVAYTIAAGVVLADTRGLYRFCVFLASIVAILLLRAGYRIYKDYSETIPYMAFLAWYNQNRSA